MGTVTLFIGKWAQIVDKLIPERESYARWLERVVRQKGGHDLKERKYIILSVRSDKQKQKKWKGENRDGLQEIEVWISCNKIPYLKITEKSITQTRPCVLNDEKGKEVWWLTFQHIWQLIGELKTVLVQTTLQWWVKMNRRLRRDWAKTIHTLQKGKWKF